MKIFFRSDNESTSEHDQQEDIIELQVKKLSERVANAVIALLMEKPDAVIGLPTGNTPLKLYEALSRAENAGLVDFSKATFFNLDEYDGLSPSDPLSYNYYINQNFYKKLNNPPPPSHRHAPDGKHAGKTAEQEAKAYGKKIRKAGGLDLAILGLGRNGHIAFNEPGISHWDAPTRVVSLSAQTIEDAKSAFEHRAEAPTRGITIGMQEIQDAKNIFVIAKGENKARIVKHLLEEPITPAFTPDSVPAHMLRTLGDKVTVFLDDGAASLLSKSSAKDSFYQKQPDQEFVERILEERKKTNPFRDLKGSEKTPDRHQNDAISR
jgi:glucosamine-6-phosphate deaminase